MLSSAAYRKLKANREENLMKYSRSKDAYNGGRKIGKANDEKGDAQAEKARPIIEKENKTHFSLLECDSDVQDVKYSL